MLSALGLGDRFFLYDEFANWITHRYTLGFVYAKFVAAGNPFEAFLKQTCSDKTNGLIHAGTPPTAGALVDGPNPFGIFFFNGCLLVA
jgi:hypothetical protein